jgi:hypothetical protein
MNFQPNLYVSNIGSVSAKTIFTVLKKLGLGKIDYTQLVNNDAFVKMKSWNLSLTQSTRLLLQQGKPLLLYYSPNKYWKVYSYEHRFMEHEQMEKKKRIEKQKRAILAQKAKEQRMIELEKERFQKKMQEEEKFMDSITYIDYDIHRRMNYELKPIPKLDYGNASELYHKIKAKTSKLLRNCIKIHQKETNASV